LGGKVRETPTKTRKSRIRWVESEEKPQRKQEKAESVGGKGRENPTKTRKN